ncbi:hypothetical protein [Actinocrispum wychmicini]|uniref:Uncharacterized protein n=1 Tax=Actinocrispum wychmicini TaxID=1213861 RepID=A0A4R2JMN0_9PSEU|nr:hypothetical protein [Actinocrispum wychmicini]TCO60544.1 hypothetical protein EV192_103119 [Actinocrispum wychmicini]
MTGDLPALVTRVAAVLPTPVDDLQVAAMLESQGVTDQAAADQYGMDDVFALAHEVFRRLSATVVTRAVEIRETVRRSPHEVCHGLLYMLPSAVYPAVFMALSGPVMVRGMVFATALGWVWGAGTSWVAYRLLGLGLAGHAGRTLRLFGLVAMGLGLVGAILIALDDGAGLSLVLFVLAQTGFQAASGVLVFYRKEFWLTAAMIPACLAGLVHLVSRYNDALLGPVLLCGTVSTGLAIALAWRASFGGKQTDSGRRPAARALTLGALPYMGYAALCAAFLLYTDSRYVTSNLDLAIGVTPLVLGMGVVESSAHRFFTQAGRLVRRSRLPAQFRGEVWRILLRELMVCLLFLVGIGLALLVPLAWFGVLTSRGALLIDGHLVLGGAFFLGFVLARQGEMRWLLWTVAGVLVANIVSAEVLAQDLAPYGHVPIFLMSSIALVVLMLTALRTSVRQIRHYK